MVVSEMQRKLSLRAEREPNHQFGDLYSLLHNKVWLLAAHDDVKRNSGSVTSGCDGINMRDFDEELEKNLEELRESLKAETFEPYPVRRVHIPKSDGKMRPLGIPSIRDRIVQEALRMILEPIFEAGFSRHSYGFRPGRCTMDAISYIGCHLTIKGRYYWIIEGDISSYFDTIKHRRLLRCLKKRIEDRKLLNLIWKFLRAGVMEGKLFRDTLMGTPQGGIISPLLANIYLHELDTYMEAYTNIPPWKKKWQRKKGMANYLYVRYADDFIIMCNGTKEQASDMREEIQHFLTENLRLKLSMEKTKITHVNDGFKFLGFHISRGIGTSGKLAPRLRIPEEAMERCLDKIKAATDHSMFQDSVETKFLALGRIIGGWCRYYQYTSSPSFMFGKLHHKVFWLVAHWLARKYQISIPQTFRKFRGEGNSFTNGTRRLIMPDDFYGKRYLMKQLKNPYTQPEIILPREENSEDIWIGNEQRVGMADLRMEILFANGGKCQRCGNLVSDYDAHVDHIKPRSHFKKSEDADTPENLWLLCIPCHRAKTKSERQRESRMH